MSAGAVQVRSRPFRALCARSRSAGGGGGVRPDALRVGHTHYALRAVPLVDRGQQALAAGAATVEQPPDAAESSPEQQLLQAAAAGDAARVQQLLAAGAEPACEADGGVTPLMLAAESGSVKAVQALLEAGAPWQAQDVEGYTAGDYASGGKHRDVVQLLLDWAVKAELILGGYRRACCSTWIALC